MHMARQPLTPADCDLRGLDYMPLFGNHLFGSEFNAAATDAEWRAALTLWWAAWNQVPAGSLPNDDPALCRLADLGRDVKTWKKLRARAMHGFVECDDGRLYHEFICKQALVAWDKRVKERDRKSKWRAEQEAKRQSKDADVPRDKTGTEQPQNADVPADGKGRDGTGRDSDSVANATAGKPAVEKPKSPEDMAKAELWQAAVSVLEAGGCPKSQCRTFMGKLVGDYGFETCQKAIAAAVTHQPADAREYITAACKRISGERKDPITVESDAAEKTKAMLDAYEMTPDEKAKAAAARATAVQALKTLRKEAA